MQKYAFLDRDGTFLWEPTRPEGADPRETFPLKKMKEFQFMEGAIEGMKKLAQKGYGLVMVTNQTFLGTKRHPRAMFDQVMSRIEEELGEHGIAFEFIMVCPHGPEEGCDCRKPKLGGLRNFLDSVGGVDYERSLMFGDRDSDEEFAKNLGVRFVRIATNERFVVPSDI